MAYVGGATSIPMNGTGWWDNSLQALPGSSVPPIAGSQLDMAAILGNSPAVASADPSMWGSLSSWMNDSGILGKTLANGDKVQGWGAPALGAIGGLANSYFGMQQLKLAKDTLDQNKRAFQLNFDAQKQTTNAQLEDRQRARVASNPGAYQSVGDYMNKYGIKG